MFIEDFILSPLRVWRAEHKDLNTGVFCFYSFHREHHEARPIKRLSDAIKHDGWNDPDWNQHAPAFGWDNPPRDVVCGVESFDMIEHWFPVMYWNRLRSYRFVLRQFEIVDSRHVYNRDPWQITFYRSKAKLVDEMSF